MLVDIFLSYIFIISHLFIKNQIEKGGHIMTYQKLEKLIEKYGANTTFGEAIAREKGNK